ncbi:hypothetical protein [Streptomyces sp. TRM68416]|uniref:hypothetical protein n=1 Tax=Streptomyces sp. TRM68416 TaxID=2758412 RepID=UPI001661A4C0|nr:hypothetical protein [Streptomyces sp. TRM68416]MBD0837392.1 hypothetical protein [Streptomyces sp. TRM68416]
MTHLPASPAEPRRTRGGAGGAGRGQWVRYPLRVVVDADAYAPGDTNFYGKVKALSKGRRATASMEKIADYLGVSKSSGERAARRLGRPAPTDGVQELFTKRQTHKITGTGQTAERWCRDLDAGEPYVCGPVRAADTLRGIEHRLYLGLRYAILVKGHQPTLTELARLLRHHGGKLTGQPLAEASVARLLDRLAALGWISLDKRAGYRGRHLITVHDDPVHPATEETPTPHPGDGSGPDLDDGSPAYKEDLQLNDRGSTPERGSFRRRRDHRSYGPDPVDTAGNEVDVPPALRGAVRPPQRPAYAGPPLTLSPRVWHVLAPVADLLPACTPFTVRRIAREVGRQLDQGVFAEDIRDQLTRLRAWTPTDTIRDPGRWILGAALPDRPGHCGTTDCHYGYQRFTGTPCKACAELTTERIRAAHPPSAFRHECAHCYAPSRQPLPHGLCATCRPA